MQAQFGLLHSFRGSIRRRQCTIGEVNTSRLDWKQRKKDARYGHDTWRPIKRLSRDQMEHLKTLHSEQPDTWTVPKLATGFGISTSAVTRILRSKFEPSAETKERQDASALKRRAERGQKLTGEKEK
eukprot:Em0009g809a